MLEQIRTPVFLFGFYCTLAETCVLLSRSSSSKNTSFILEESRLNKTWWVVGAFFIVFLTFHQNMSFIISTVLHVTEHLWLQRLCRRETWTQLKISTAAESPNLKSDANRRLSPCISQRVSFICCLCCHSLFSLSSEGGSFFSPSRTVFVAPTVVILVVTSHDRSMFMRVPSSLDAEGHFSENSAPNTSKLFGCFSYFVVCL